MNFFQYEALWVERDRLEKQIGRLLKMREKRGRAVAVVRGSEYDFPCREVTIHVTQAPDALDAEIDRLVAQQWEIDKALRKYERENGV